MSKIPALLVNYNYDPTWLKDYPNLEVTMYDRSDDGVERDLTQYGRVIKTPNRGDVDYDKLTYLVENYDNLPDVFLWSKTNIFKFMEKDYLDEALEKQAFKPLLKQDHRTYSDHFGEVCKYIGSPYGTIYAERADSWFFNAGLDTHHRFQNWQEWCDEFYLPKERFIPFAPGGSYLLTREKVHNYSKDFYDKMRETLPYAQRPVEAHCAERSYFYLWR